MNLAEIINYFAGIAEKAGKIPLKYYGTVVDLGKNIDDVLHTDENADTKSSLTSVDLETQKIILQELYPHFSHMGIYSEETDDEIRDLESKFAHVRRLVNNRFTVIIDPIDGTTNFLNTNPNNMGKKGNPDNKDRFGIQITLAYGNEIVGGVVYLPVLGKLISTYKNGPTLLNGEQIKLQRKRFSPDNPLRISSTVEEKDIGRDLQSARQLFTTNVSFEASCYNLLALVTQEMDAYALSSMDLLDFGCTALAYENAGGFCGDHESKKVNISQRLVGTRSGIEVKGFMLLAPSEQYHRNMMKYLRGK